MMLFIAAFCMHAPMCACCGRWVNIGRVKGGTVEYCHAGTQCVCTCTLAAFVAHVVANLSRYLGPCRDEIQTFGRMSANAIKRWSEGCLVNLFHCWLQGWCFCAYRLGRHTSLANVSRCNFLEAPCHFSVSRCLLGCTRDYEQMCPEGWERRIARSTHCQGNFILGACPMGWARQGDEQKCKPPADYTGPCRWVRWVAIHGHFVAQFLKSSYAFVRFPICCLLAQQLFACIAPDSLEWQGDCKLWRAQSRYAQRLV